MLCVKELETQWKHRLGEETLGVDDVDVAEVGNLGALEAGATWTQLPCFKYSSVHI